MFPSIPSCLSVNTYPLPLPFLYTHIFFSCLECDLCQGNTGKLFERGWILDILGLWSIIHCVDCSSFFKMNLIVLQSWQYPRVTGVSMATVKLLSRVYQFRSISVQPKLYSWIALYS